MRRCPGWLLRSALLPHLSFDVRRAPCAAAGCSSSPLAQRKQHPRRLLGIRKPRRTDPATLPCLIVGPGPQFCKCTLSALGLHPLGCGVWQTHLCRAACPAAAPAPVGPWGPLQLAQLLMSVVSITRTADTVASANAASPNHRALALGLSVGHSLSDVSQFPERLHVDFQTQWTIGPRGPRSNQTKSNPAGNLGPLTFPHFLAEYSMNLAPLLSGLARAHATRYNLLLLACHAGSWLMLACHAILPLRRSSLQCPLC